MVATHSRTFSLPVNSLPTKPSANHKPKPTRTEMETTTYTTAIRDSLKLYAGLSPIEFLTIVAVMVITYKIVCGMFVSEEDFKPKKKEPVWVGEITEDELKTYNGSDPKKPLLMAIRGQIYDVTTGREFYGPGGSYHMFVGKDASRALALLSFKPQDINGNLEGLDESELGMLEEWELKFVDKYPKVGTLSNKSTEI